MTNTKPVFHGSDIEKISEYYHIDQNSITNFAGNVNPLGLSPSVKEAVAAHVDLFSSYPDRDYKSLRNTIAEYCDVPADFILPGNGSSELISLLIETRAPKRTLILGPTYSEYSRELSFSGSTQDYYHLQEAEDFELDVEDLCRTLLNGYDFLILCNPNNPTSSAILKDEMRALLSFCANRDIFVMIDETYVEFAPSVQEVTAVPYTKDFSNLMVLRGVSKFYAAPGMRFGYGITGNKEFLSQMKEKQIPWSLNSLGAYAGRADVQRHFLHPSDTLINPDGNDDRMFLVIKKDVFFQGLFSIWKLYPCEDFKTRSNFFRCIRSLYKRRTYDPRLLFFPMSGWRIRPLLHYETRR